MYAGKRCNGNPISTKGYKLDGVGPVDNRPSTNKDGGPNHLCATCRAWCAESCRQWAGGMAPGDGASLPSPSSLDTNLEPPLNSSLELTGASPNTSSSSSSSLALADTHGHSQDDSHCPRHTVTPRPCQGHLAATSLPPPSSLLRSTPAGGLRATAPSCGECSAVYRTVRYSWAAMCTAV